MFSQNEEPFAVAKKSQEFVDLGNEFGLSLTRDEAHMVRSVYVQHVAGHRYRVGISFGPNISRPDIYSHPVPYASMTAANALRLLVTEKITSFCNPAEPISNEELAS